MSWLKCVLLGALVVFVSCKTDTSQSVTPPDETAKEAVKKALEGIAETGVGGSEIGLVQIELEKLKKTNPTLADDLMEDASALMSTALSADQVKAKAKAMLKKLEGIKEG